MSPLSNSVYSSVFTYNPYSYVLTRPYQHLTTKTLIEPHHITCVSLDISILIVRFGDQTCTRRVHISMNHQNSLPVSWLFDQLSDNNVSENGLSLSSINEQILEVILMLGNNAILMACQINARYNTYARDSVFRHIN